jgi:autotransporter-associated beta strand protein
MKNEQRRGSPLAGLTVAAILLASTAGYVSALSKMFQSPLMFEESASDFLGDDASSATAAAQTQPASFQQYFARSTAAWLTNALPAYSSGRARELWYLSLDSSGDRRLSIETTGNYNAPVSTSYSVFNPNFFNNLAPASGSGGTTASKTSAPFVADATLVDQSWKNSAGNTNFNDGASWTSGVPPGVGDRAIFATTGGSAGINAQPNLTASVSIANLDFSQSTTSGYDLTSNNTSVTLTLTSTGTAGGTQAIVTSNSSGTNTVDAPIILGGGAGTTQTFSIASGGTFIINGVISESGLGTKISKTGSGILTLTNANSYTGGTALTAGTIAIGNNTALGSGTLTFSNGTTLQSADGNARIISNAWAFSTTGNIFGAPGTGDLTLSNTSSLSLGTTAKTWTVNNTNTTLAAAFTNTGNLIKDGPGTLILSGASTYSGKTIISNGAISASTLNNVSGGTASSNLGHPTTAANGTIDIGSTTNTGQLTYTGTGQTTDRVINLAGTTGGATLDDSGTGTLTFSSDFTATGVGAKTLTLQGSTSGVGVISGKIVDSSSGATSLTKSGTGTWTLSGAAANTYSGLTTVNAGELDLSKTAAINAIAGNLTIGDDVGGPNSAIVKLINADQIADTSDVTINSDGVLNLNGKNETIDALNAASANASVTLGIGTLTVGANNEAAANFHGVISGTGGFTKVGLSGTQILSGTNLYFGDTQILAGDLRFDSGGTSNSSTIRLGDTTGTNYAVLSLGVGNGNNVGSALEVRSGSSGPKILRSLATTGTNTYSGNITLNDNLSVESSTGGTFLFQGGSIAFNTRTLTVDAQVVNVGVGPNGADAAGSQGTVIFNEALTSSSTTGGSLVKDGSGTLIIQSTGNTYTGTNNTALNSNGTQIKGGTLGIYGDTSLGLAPSVATDNIFFAASAASNPTTSHILQDTSSNITLGTTRNISVATGVTGTFDSNGNTFSINGIIHGSGAIATTTGANAGGTVVFTNANTYSGGTTVQSGTLLVNNAPGSSGTGSGMVTVDNGGTLGGGGFINTGANNVAINGTVDPGVAANTFGALTLTTASTIFGSTGIFHVDIGGSAVDQLFTSGTFDLTAIGDTISFNVTSPLTEPSYTLATYSGPALGLFDNANTPSGYTLFYNPLGELDLIATPIPEPSTWIGAALALVAIGFTQRRRFAKRSRVTG